MVGVSVEGGKRGRPSGSMVVISVSVVDGMADGRGFDDGEVDFSVGKEVDGFVAMSRSSSSGRGTVSAMSCISSSDRR